MSSTVEPITALLLQFFCTLRTRRWPTIAVAGDQNEEAQAAGGGARHCA